ncbi:rubredoxin-like domain-containing protein, partial [Clostridium sp. HMP27]
MGLEIKNKWMILGRIFIMKKFVCTVCGYIHEGEAAP